MSDKMQDALNHAQDMVKGHHPNHREYQVAEALLGLAAARIAYASEFPLDAEGLPDVGNIHVNIRKLKSDAAYWKARAKDAEEYIDESGR